MNKICESVSCNNVIQGKRNDAKYCSTHCKNNMKAYRKQNGTNTIPRGRQIQTGDMLGDVVGNVTMGILSNPNNAIQAGTTSAMNAALPHALNTVKERPFLSLLLAGGGLWAAPKLLKSCSTTIRTIDGEEQEERTCTEPSGVTKGAAAISCVLFGGLLVKTLFNQNNGVSDTGNTRVIPTSTPLNTPIGDEQGRFVQFAPSAS